MHSQARRSSRAGKCRRRSALAWPTRTCTRSPSWSRRARAARVSRRQYRGIFRRFADLLRDELGRPPLGADLTADTIAAYASHLEQRGGRGGRPAALSTRRVHITMLRAFAAEIGLAEVAAAVRLPAHRVGQPETLTAVEYGNLLRCPDRRSQLGKRD